MLKIVLLVIVLSLKLFHVPAKTFFKINIKETQLNAFQFQSKPAFSEANCALLCNCGCGIFYDDDKASLCFTAQGVRSELENNDAGDVRVFATEEGIPSWCLALQNENCLDGCSSKCINDEYFIFYHHQQ